MIMPDPAQFAAATAALDAYNSANAKEINRAWSQALRGATRGYLGRVIPGVTPSLLYAAIAMAAETLVDPVRRAELETRAAALLAAASPDTLDSNPRDIVVVLPAKASPALAASLVALGLTCHTDARKSRGITCCLWQGRAAPSIVAPLVAEERGSVVIVPLPEKDATRDATPVDDMPEESDLREPEIRESQAPQTERSKRTKTDTAPMPDSAERKDTIAQAERELEVESDTPPQSDTPIAGDHTDPGTAESVLDHVFDRHRRVSSEEPRPNTATVIAAVPEGADLPEFLRNDG